MRRRRRSFTSCEVYRQQLCGGRHFLHEHPETARSWADEQIQGILNDPAVGSVVGHQCMYGQTAPTANGERLPARKATRWMSSAPEIFPDWVIDAEAAIDISLCWAAVRPRRQSTRRSCVKLSSEERRRSAGARGTHCRLQ